MEERNGVVQTTEQNSTSESNVSYFVLEGIMTHFSLMFKRMFILIIALIILVGAIVAGFLWYISLPVEDYSGVTVENDDGNANYIGNNMNGDFNYGESD